MELQNLRTKASLDLAYGKDADKVRLNPFKRDEQQASI